MDSNVEPSKPPTPTELNAAIKAYNERVYEPSYPVIYTDTANAPILKKFLNDLTDVAQEDRE